MVTLTTAQDALKIVYLGVLTEQLNIKSNPLLSKINQTSADVFGKEIHKITSYGVNGGVGAGTEDGDLPKAGGNNYVKFISTLKNLYGTIEISDKAIRASESSAGAFVNLLNAEMEGLIKSSNFNLGRMLYGDGTGVLTKSYEHFAGNNYIVPDSMQNFVEGMKVSIYNKTDGEYHPQGACLRVSKIDRTTNKVYFDKFFTVKLDPAENLFVVQGSYNLEITGLGQIFGDSTNLYGLSRLTYPWLKPYQETEVGEISETKIQKAIDYLEEVVGSNVDFITCSSAVKRAYQEHLSTYKRNIDVMELNGGYKALSYNGIPLVSDRFIDKDTMYLLNTKDFNLHQLCDWQWLESEDGRIIHQVAGKPTFTATLVKYADLICDHPGGQAKLSGITVA